MLNYVWLALIVVGILTATGRDMYDTWANTYGNDIPWHLSTFEIENAIDAGQGTVDLTLSREEVRKHFPLMKDDPPEVVCRAEIHMHDASHGSILLRIPANSPAVFSDIASAQGNDKTVVGTMARRGGEWLILLEPVRFVFMKKITTAAFEAATLAVQIAIGLIGIMALWLGVMRVAEASGLIVHLARLVRPLTVRLFPDVPPDHPAIAAILMNVSANMLGLGNAATPFGLKAMEELNRVNHRPGTASNAMCTFLAMNTSCITLIPATAVAVRAASGSADPAVIIGTTFLASTAATLSGVTAAKLLQRLPMFRMARSET
ncbi:MAG: nucleoside recognition domain-containing protein [Bacteroidota bacterium]|nr:nucleoside recognition domain-containing protein [Bacteroidota bacterium]